VARGKKKGTNYRVSSTAVELEIKTGNSAEGKGMLQSNKQIEWNYTR